MFCSFILLLVSGILKFPGFINISDPFLYLILTDIHDFNGLILSIIVILHGIFHLKWILLTTGKIIHHKRYSHIFRNHGFNSHVIKYIVSVGLIISSFLVGFTGISKYPGILVDLRRNYQLSGIFTTIHDWGGVAMGILALIHFILNWRWMVGFTKRILKGYHGKKNILMISSLSLIITFGIPVRFSLANFNFSRDTGTISIENVGVYNFLHNDVQSLRPEIFKQGHFSIFDILVYLDMRGQIDMDFYFDASMNTYVIDSINNRKNWWYYAYYDGGWVEDNSFRLDHYPYKLGMTINLFQDDPTRIVKVYEAFKKETDRHNANNGSVIIPLIDIDIGFLKFLFYNITVTPHNLRNDTFQVGVITAIDVILSLGDQGLITYRLRWYDSIGTASYVRSYWVETINNRYVSGRCGFVYESGDSEFFGMTGNHIHIPSDIRVINSPEYVRWFYICI
ncbi:MAG: DUF4405 domain-containing protein [Promethearchaeota archaeon]|jgi:hypothetical protein